jgi:hypothetical protein
MTRDVTGTVPAASSTSRYPFKVWRGLDPWAPPRPTTNRPGSDASSSVYSAPTSSAEKRSTAMIPVAIFAVLVARTTAAI